MLLLLSLRRLVRAVSPWAVLLVMASSASATIITTAVGVGADAYVRGGINTGFNFGSDASLLAKNDCCSSDYDRKMYMRFDLSPIGSFDVDTATVSLTFSGGGSAHVSFQYELYGLLDAHSGELWDEGLLTWNNAPANDLIHSTNMSVDAVLLATFSWSGSSVGDALSITDPAIAAFLNNDSNGSATFMMTRDSASSHVHVFASREHGTLAPPGLEVTLIPEPTTALLLTLGLAGLVMRRRAHTPRH